MADFVKTRPETRPAEPPIVVKKYANRRLYDTRSSSYITLDNLADMARQGHDLVVYDAKSGEDITRSVLTQIIVEEEGKGCSLLPTGFLRQLIGFYGDQMQGLVPKYLEQAMTAFAQQQEQMRSTMQKTMGSVGTLFPFGNMEEVSRQNMAMMERAFSLFTPFYRPAGETGPADLPSDSATKELAALRSEVATLRGKAAVSPPRGPVKAALRVLDRWSIPDPLGAITLGSSGANFIAGLRAGTHSFDTRDMQDRARLLLDIYEGVFALLRDPAAEQNWIKTPREEFAGSSLLDLMTEGSQRNLIRVQAFVDYANGR